MTKKKKQKQANKQAFGSLYHTFVDEKPMPYSPVIEMKDMTKKKVKEITKRLLARDRVERENGS